MVMKYTSFAVIIIIKMVWLLIMTNHQFMAAGGDRSRCIGEEKKVLLELKAWLGSRINGFDDDKSSFLPSWVDEPLDDGGNCCDGWERVTCDSLTARVLKLDLNYIYGLYPDNNNFNSTWTSTGFAKLSTLKQLEKLYIKRMELDTSFLTSLSTIKSLKVLDLTDNNLFKDNFSSQDCEALLGLRKLEELSLARNTNIMNQPTGIKINMTCLSSLPSLTSLSLYGNYPMEDSSSLIEGLDGLQQVQVLNMSFCGLTTKDVRSLSKLVKLKNLDLSNNHLGKDVLGELLAFPSLQFLNLSLNFFEGSLTNEDLIGFHHLEILNLAGCRLNGTIPAQNLCKISKLQELDLSDNLFEGGIPSCINELSFLRRLNFSHNQLSGNLSSSMFRDLNSLEYIGLLDNSFQGTFFFSNLANFSKLEEVLISNNNKLLIETELTEWVPKFQLKTLVLSNCNLNILSGAFPKFLFFQKDLSYLDLSRNGLGGSFPNWLLVNNTRLKYLYLQDNHFGEYLYLPDTKNQIIELDISNNQLKGHIPANMDQLLPLLIHMDISFNAFDGDIPNSLGNMSSLSTLLMSNNKLAGEVPIEIMSMDSLFALDLSSNNLIGFFSGFNLSRVTNLEFIDISHNKMSGQIPRRLTGNLTTYPIIALIMRDNSFFGLFPCELAMAFLLDISDNSFTGALPACSSRNHLRHLSLYGNKFTGLVPETIFNSSRLITLDIGNNFFSGRIPNLIHDQSKLEVLLLRGNGFSGAIPHQLCKLQMLNLLDLSHNSFSGSIPTCFGTNISFGEKTSHLSDLYIIPFRNDEQSPFKLMYMADVVISSKHRVDSYTGKILGLMSGLDLSSNNLEGEIPDALGNLSRVYAMNLSHNWLGGPIPQTFSNLMEIESLDLSHNNLSGEIPSKLVNLNRLGTFSVAYNNLSGRLPERKGQFITFEENSYAGNPFLCGSPLKKDCKVNDDDDDVDNHDRGHEKWYDIDREGFLASFMGTYIVYILTFVAVLWINTRWRNIWFNFVENLLFSSYYFLCDTLYKCFRVRI